MAPTSRPDDPGPLSAERTGPPTDAPGDPLVLVHGFTQTARCWGPIDDELRRSHGVVAVDAPGHGGSASVDLDLVAGASAIVATAGRGTYVGYSMGGRFCLHAALAHPDQVTRLVLISATGGIDDEHERAERRRSDDALADRIESIGVPAFLDEWLALPLFAGIPPERSHRSERLTNTAAGLASSLRQAGTGTQEPLWDRLGSLSMPVLVIAGADDPKFTALARRLVDAMGPNAELAVVPDAGHTVHLEQPDAFLQVLRPWLARTGDSPGRQVPVG